MTAQETTQVETHAPESRREALIREIQQYYEGEARELERREVHGSRIDFEWLALRILDDLDGSRIASLAAPRLRAFQSGLFLSGRRVFDRPSALEAARRWGVSAEVVAAAIRALGCDDRQIVPILAAVAVNELDDETAVRMIQPGVTHDVLFDRAIGLLERRKRQRERNAGTALPSPAPELAGART